MVAMVMMETSVVLEAIAAMEMVVVEAAMEALG